jgi:MATE family multidrug resistance protein
MRTYGRLDLFSGLHAPSAVFDSIRNEIPRMLILAGPMIASQLLQMSMGFVDTLMVGRLGPASLAAVSLGGAIYHPLFLICGGVMSAVSPIVSQSHGAGESDPIIRTVRQGLWLATGLAVPGILVMWNVEPFLLAIGIEPAVAVQTQGYLRAVSFAFVPGLWYWVLRHSVEALGRPRPVMVITFVGAVTNGVMNYILMFGKLGFPAMGLVGTGWSTTIVVFVIFFSLVLFVRSQRALAGFDVFTQFDWPDAPYLRRIFRLGWPIGIMFGIETGLFAAAAFLMGRIGTNELAAHQIALQCAAFTFMVPLGLAFASTIRVGFETGAGNPTGARAAGYTGMILSAAVMAVFAVLFVVAPRPILGLYIDLSDVANAGVVELGVVLLSLAAVFQIFDGVQIASAGALRGLHDTRIPMVIGFVSYWLVGLTLSYMLGFTFGLGPGGIWWGLVSGLATAAVLLGLRFRSLSSHLSGREHAGPPTPPSTPESDDDQDVVDGMGPRGNTEPA